MPDQNSGNEGMDMEEAIRERHLAEQGIFKNVLANVRKKHRKILFWTVVILSLVAVFFAVFGCSLIQWGGICPLFESSAK